ncbi:hypothetical protein GCM10017083_21730 [Thalassobaculum fulvum]|uniref:Uncharacterized protein n=1 Tax=Thalassobaculum fulvum TaxID=1633335 RepID=A0A918XSD1_9PROT|nr:hypothetical protein GCM10017083_21730 [Thalassobaculum fulvum]
MPQTSTTTELAARTATIRGTVKEEKSINGRAKLPGTVAGGILSPANACTAGRLLQNFAGHPAPVAASASARGSGRRRRRDHGAPEKTRSPDDLRERARPANVRATARRRPAARRR